MTTSRKLLTLAPMLILTGCGGTQERPTSIPTPPKTTQTSGTAISCHALTVIYLSHGDVLTRKTADQLDADTKVKTDDCPNLR